MLTYVVGLGFPSEDIYFTESTEVGEVRLFDLGRDYHVEGKLESILLSKDLASGFTHSSINSSCRKENILVGPRL